MVEMKGDGRVTFAVYAPDAQRVEVCGSFTGWRRNAVELERVGDGWHRVSLEVPPGEHEFQYIVDGRDAMADYAADGVRMNIFGSWVSRVVVPRSGCCRCSTVGRGDAWGAGVRRMVLG